MELYLHRQVLVRERDQVENTGLPARMLLNWTLQEIIWEAVTEFMWLRLRASDEFL